MGKTWPVMFPEAYLNTYVDLARKAQNTLVTF